jgi:glycosyltransferase involved in cell wall biosynthesis
VTTVSVVIPVKNGERYLGEVLAALGREGVDEMLVIDSGSRDRSVQIARAAGVDVLEIASEQFGHGRTRNLGAERTTGELICFLTQDATPVEGWLEAYREAFSLAPDVGAAYGPHLARPDTSPMIARELDEFFVSFAAGAEPVLQTVGDPPFLSNVNACYARACWAQLRFRDVGFAEDQAFGADLLAAGWRKVYHPRAAVWHAHDYGIVDFMRRYFDEFRGLRETTGHVEHLKVGASTFHVLRSVAADRRWMAKHGMGELERTPWTARAAAHHAGRRVFSSLGSRADRLPRGLTRRLSLEGRDHRQAPDQSPPAAPEAPLGVSVPLPTGVHMEPIRGRSPYESAAELQRYGPAPLLKPASGMAERQRLQVAMVIPPFRAGSGGHNTLLQVLSRLERRGHVCSVWVHDDFEEMRDVWPAVIRHDIREFFAAFNGPVYKGFDAWHGADVALATGWQTVHPVLRLERCYARAYLVNDHEPEFYPTSSERILAEDTYRHGLHCIAASPWLRDLLIHRYGATADVFQLGVDHEIYQPRPVPRRTDTIVYYCRAETPRRAVPSGLSGLRELFERRPGVRIVLFGTKARIDTAFPYQHLGSLSREQLSWLYSEATIGLCLSLTNFSLIPKEMLACGLPCVELAGVSGESIFGQHGPLELTEVEPRSIADALERLLDDRDVWERRSREGIEFVASHSWDRATDEVEAGLRHALRIREGDELRNGSVEEGIASRRGRAAVDRA